MASSHPALIVRVAANLAELKANLAEGKSQIETTTAAMTKLASSRSDLVPLSRTGRAGRW